MIAPDANQNGEFWRLGEHNIRRRDMEAFRINRLGDAGRSMQSHTDRSQETMRPEAGLGRRIKVCALAPNRVDEILRDRVLVTR
jgi:hypothetical protein